MTKKLTLSTQIDLPDDEIEAAHHLVKVTPAKEALQTALAVHFPNATISHAITGDEPETPVKVRKQRVKHPVAEVVPEVEKNREVAPESQQEVPAPRGRHKAAA